ncbi:MAG: hypothetical protein WCJ37_02275 [Syntrophus sp. (in: bacteria)]
MSITSRRKAKRFIKFLPNMGLSAQIEEALSSTEFIVAAARVDIGISAIASQKIEGLLIEIDR